MASNLAHLVQPLPRPLPDPHVRYLRGLLHVLETTSKAGGRIRPLSESRFVVRRDGKATFWELVGVRIKGHPHLVFGAVRFAQQWQGAAPASRRSLAALLRSPLGRGMGEGREVPSYWLEMVVPEAEEQIVDFIAALQDGERRPSVVLDTRLVELAFDCRRGNPSVAKAAAGASSAPKRLLFRTAAGHVLSAHTRDLDVKLLGDSEFVGLTDVHQHTAERRIALPTLIVHRDFLAMVSSPGRDAEAWLKHFVPFLPRDANPQHVLDSRL